MARPHALVAVLTAAVTVAASTAAGAQERSVAPLAPSTLAGPRALTAVGAVPRSAERLRRAQAQRDEVAQPARRPAAAQPVRFSIAGGLSQPTGDAGEIANLGFNVTGSASFRPAAFPLGLRADVQANRFTLDEDDYAEGSALILGGQLNGVFEFPQGQSASAIRPYVLGGLGLGRVSVSLDGDGDDPDAETALMFGFGAGLTFRAGSYDTFVELRYQSVRTDDDPTTFVPVVVGIRF